MQGFFIESAKGTRGAAQSDPAIEALADQHPEKKHVRKSKKS